MAASHTLPHPFAIPQISKLGVLTLYGYGIRITMQAGHLQIDDGIGAERRKLRLPRVNHRLKRLVCISEDGFITLSALKWLTDTGASFVMLDRLGKVRVVTGPTSASEARLRRSQAMALSNGQALPVARELMAAKLTGQEMLVREKLKNVGVANVIAELQERLSGAGTIDAICGIESRAASEYWGAWRGVPVSFPRKDLARIPAHWLTFGPRHSPLTGGPRRSVNPANSLLNYVNAVAESECRLAACACGLDPGIGFVHTDTANRDSLALDLIETIRPSIEAWLLNWLMEEPLRRSDFSEAPDGNCRISSDLCSKLSETAPTWGKLVAPWAEYVAHTLWSNSASRARSLDAFKTPLTQRRRREAKGTVVPIVKTVKVQHVCRGCGKPLRKDHQNCGDCAPPKEMMIHAARTGRIATQSPEARAKHAESMSRQTSARYAWDSSTQPTWLTTEFFSEKIQPELVNLSASTIQSCLSVSRMYASKIRQSKSRPHPRHWQTLSDLVGHREADSASRFPSP
jgi:CRISPR-associated endonuclease Cas1